MAIGAMIAVMALFLGHTVETSMPDYSLTSITGSIFTQRAEVANISKIQIQSLTFYGGAVLFLAGAIFVAAGAIVEKLQEMIASSMFAREGLGTDPADEAAQATRSDTLATPTVPEMDPEEAAEQRRRDDLVMHWTIGVAVVAIAILVMLALTSGNNSSSALAQNEMEVVPTGNIQADTMITNLQ